MKNNFILKDDYIPEPRRSDIEKAVLLGQRYISSHRPRKTPLAHIFFDQIKYLSPSLWILQLAALSLVGYICAVSYELDGIALMLSAVPVIAMMNVPELVKDMLFDMSELERSTKIGSGVILLIRLAVISIIDLIVLAVAVTIVYISLGSGFVPLLLFAVAVYNVENMICLGIVRLFKIRGRNTAVCLSATVMVIFVIFCMCITPEMRAALISNIPLLTVAVVLSAALFAGQIMIMIKKIPFGGLLNEN